MKWLMFEVQSKIKLIPRPVILIPGVRDEGEAMGNRCEACTRWSECNGVDDQCPWKGRE